MPRRHEFVRTVAVLRMQRRLEHTGWPRLHMGLVTTLTGAVGMLASFVMLQLGLQSMAWRYPLALLVAYAAFLGMVGLWVRGRAADGLDLLNLPDGAPSLGPAGKPGANFSSGGGGDFAGGGASASFDTAAGTRVDTELPRFEPEPAAAVGEGLASVAEGDELAIPLLLLALVLGSALASVYVVYTAPVFLAEVAVDGALSVALYRWLRGEDAEHWLPTAVRRSALPFLATAVFLAAVGAGLSAYAPGAHSVGEVLRAASAAR